MKNEQTKVLWSTLSAVISGVILAALISHYAKPVKAIEMSAPKAMISSRYYTEESWQQ
jgi:hypothetical protein